MKTNDEIIETLLRLRDEQGLSTSEVARRVNMAKSGVSRYFNKTREFPLNRIDDFAKAFHTTPEEILGLNDKKEMIDLSDDDIFAYQGKPISKEQMDLIKSMLNQFTKDDDN